MIKNLDELLQRFDAGEVLAAARLMSVVERGGEDAETILDRLFSRTGGAYRVGITGGTGGGKSTVINALVKYRRGEGHTVGVVAEDPTSPFTGGAILGDRVRMSHAVGDRDVFVRSIASRGTQTGFSVLADELADVLDAFGRDVILLETTGVGQLETKIRFSADTTVVVFTPEGGDDVQGLKSGLIEVGDVFVVNKADRPGAAEYAADLAAILEIRTEGRAWTPPVVSTEARRGDGIGELAAAVDAHATYLAADGRLEAQRREGRGARLRSLVEEKVGELLWQNPYNQRRFGGIFEKVTRGDLSPYEAARRIVGAVRVDGS
ncbi:MAG: methylmalonyl Co-A mutase-associated GTPase MeaB [Gemmatimonadales bacterium]|jgi:LAO/AO transport system kinase